VSAFWMSLMQNPYAQKRIIEVL